jgi:hypothetical protein
MKKNCYLKIQIQLSVFLKNIMQNGQMCQSVQLFLRNLRQENKKKNLLAEGKNIPNCFKQTK